MNDIDNKIDKIVKNLRSEIYIWYGGLFAMSIVCYSLSTTVTKIDSEAGIALQSVLLLFLLAGLPGVFIGFKKLMKVNNLQTEIDQRISKYEFYSRIRQFLFFVFGFLVLSAHVFTVMKGSVMLLLAVLVLTLFIYPSRTRLLMECNLLPGEDAQTEEQTDAEENEMTETVSEENSEHD